MNKKKTIIYSLTSAILPLSLVPVLVSCNSKKESNNNKNNKFEYTWQRDFNTFVKQKELIFDNQKYVELINIFNKNKKVTSELKSKISSLFFNRIDLVLDVISDEYTIWIIFDPIFVNIKKQDFLIKNPFFYFNFNYNLLSITWNPNKGSDDVTNKGWSQFSYKISMNRYFLLCYCVANKIKNKEQLNDEIVDNKDKIIDELNKLNLQFLNPNPINDIFVLNNEWIVIKQKNSINRQIGNLDLEFYQYGDYSIFKSFFLSNIFPPSEKPIEPINLDNQILENLSKKLYDYSCKNSFNTLKYMIENRKYELKMMIGIDFDNITVEQTESEITVNFNSSYHKLQEKIINSKNYRILVEKNNLKIILKNNHINNVNIWRDFDLFFSKINQFIQQNKPYDLMDDLVVEIANKFQVKLDDVIDLDIKPYDNNLKIEFCVKNNIINNEKLFNKNYINFQQTEFGTKFFIEIKDYKGIKFKNKPTFIEDDKLLKAYNLMLEMQSMTELSQEQSTFKDNIVKIVKNTLNLKDEDIGLLYKQNNKYQLILNIQTNKIKNNFILRFYPIDSTKFQRLDIDTTDIYNRLKSLEQNDNNLAYLQIWFGNYIMKKTKPYNFSSDVFYPKNYNSVSGHKILMFWNPNFNFRYFPINEEKNIQYTNPEFMFIMD